MDPWSAIASAGVADDVLVAEVVAIVIAAAAAAAVVVVASAVVLPTLHREFHRTCHQSGGATSYTRGKQDNQDALQRR